MARTRQVEHRPVATADFRLLGDLDVRFGGVRWKAPSRKPRRLLAALLLEPRRQVPRDRLVDVVWDGEPPRSATGAIQVYASQLRRVLPGCDLVCCGEGYLLDIDPRTVDLHRFRLLVAGAEELPAEARAARLRKALGLFRGEPLADIGSDSLRREIEPVVVAERLSALEDLAELELALGRGDRVVPELLRLTREHPLRERLWEQLVRCQAGAGQRVDAVASYERARRLLREELGVDPGPGLREARRLLTDVPPRGRIAVTTVPDPAGVRVTTGPSAPGGAGVPVVPEGPCATAPDPASHGGTGGTGGGGTGDIRPESTGAGPAGPDRAPAGTPLAGEPAGRIPAPARTATGATAPDPATHEGAGSGATRWGPTVPRPVPEPPADSTPGPNMLPRDLVDFTGRAVELGRARSLVRDAGSRAVILAVTGMPGVGKTALATRIAHTASPAYPDGQLFVDLHGHSTERGPLPAHEALDLLLRMVGERDGAGSGPPGGDPGSGAAAGVALSAARWRAALARRRVIVVLDNAADAAHIRPLLPGDSASLIVVTSRGPLAEVDGAQPLPLGVLSTAEATALFTGVVGGGGGTGARDGGGTGESTERAAAEVARLCGNLPLAVRLGAGRLRQRPTWPVRELVRGLRAETALDELRLGSRSVGQAFQASYQALSEAEQRVFRAFGLLPGPDADTTAITALAPAPPDRMRRTLESLLDRNLLEQHASDRFRLHPLLRRYAARATIREDAEPARQAALGRLAEHYTGHARSALWLLRPQHSPLALDGPERLFPHARAAAQWLAVERPNLAAAARPAPTGLPAEGSRALARLLIHWDQMAGVAPYGNRRRGAGQSHGLGRRRAVALDGRAGPG
ncbi:BTAD domain-containing putative transcriptional regulator [Streptomyces sp. NPDC020965]|uniref:AfsR/SARP family transcriptional regulator n=1 Tax=Streptomyces sp. NPDC020965 TaxID=3365105 RepID=UPI003796247E